MNIKKFSEKDSDDSKSNLSKPMVTRKKSPNKKVKPRNRKLDGEKFLSDELDHSTRRSKPSSKKVDGENFLSDDIKIMKFTETVKNNDKSDLRTKLRNDMYVKIGDHKHFPFREEPEPDWEIVKSAWVDGFNASKSEYMSKRYRETSRSEFLFPPHSGIQLSGGNPEDAAQDFASKNCKDESKLNLIKLAWLDGFNHIK